MPGRKDPDRRYQLNPVRLLFVTLCVTSGVMVGCDDGSDKSIVAESGKARESTDAWLGQWNGPEGTFLRIEGGSGAYKLTIQNLDGPKVFQGHADGTRIRFHRNGIEETINATNGVETGMKWLHDKTRCLTVKSGEGYCQY
jgi:hypothetical protein